MKTSASGYPDSAYSIEAAQWKDLLQKFQFESNIIIPQNDALGIINNQTLMTIMSGHETGRHFPGANANGFLNTDPLRFFRMAVSLHPCVLHQIFNDLNVCGYDGEKARSNDHLTGISVPILYLGAGGGGGITGDHTSNTAASNLTYYLVKISGTDPSSDHGHADPLAWF